MQRQEMHQNYYPEGYLQAVAYRKLTGGDGSNAVDK
jgi:hypothetical protein